MSSTMLGERIKRYLAENSVEYVTSGPNVARGNINISCPWCGEDPSHHMGINLNTGLYGCWRSKSHRGRYLPHLLSRITGEENESIESYLGLKGGGVANQTDFDLLASGSLLSKKREAPSKPESLVMPSTFKPIRSTGITDRFYNYIYSNRKFRDYSRRVVKKYDLRACLMGTFKDRVIFPITSGGELVNWTGRSLHKDAKIRYLSLSHKEKMEGVPLATMSIKSCVYNYDAAFKSGGDILLVLEGPVDTVKADYFGAAYDVRAVGLFNTSSTKEQMFLLKTLATKFKVVVFIMDAGFVADAMELISCVGSGKGRFMDFNFKGHKDIGELTPTDAQRFIEIVLKRFG